MKRTLKILLVGLIAGGLLTGCPKKDDEATTDEPTQTATQEPTQTATQPEPAQTAAQIEVNEENYGKALFEVSCVKAKIDDTEQQKAIITEVHARYGFDEESFAQAQEAMKDKPDVQAALTSKMEECTPELAAGFAKAGGDDADAGTAEADESDEKQEAKKPAKAWKSGAFTDNSVSGGGLEKGILKLKVNDDGRVLGSFQGTREGKGFSIPVKGEMSKDGKFQARGNKGPNQARVTGRYKSGQLNGSIQGSINKKGLRVNYTAK